MTLHIVWQKLTGLHLSSDRTLASRFKFHLASSKRLLLTIATITTTSTIIQTQLIPTQTAQAQRLGNLGIPNQSERFFNQGRQQFEQEIDRLQTRSRSNQDLLHINENSRPQNNLPALEDPRLRSPQSEQSSERDRPNPLQNQPTPPTPPQPSINPGN